jgi:hypothetical protein
MAGKPFQSTLIPYQKEITELRSRRPPVSYARISDILRKKHGLSIQRAAIAKFVKARSGGRKVYFFRKEAGAIKAMQAQPNAESSPSIPHPQGATPSPKQEPKRSDFQFTYSERYNLRRLPPEEAAAIRRELEKNGH